ncbi:polyprenyl synthetase family protein [Spongiactinospora sp. TRM90649]|uniref:polyprenyl synthetase family protein n=1 Tax=Spongiactinospora sp. TRM90649 TaxID=3031114 RepID=UPI0023F6FE7E|nr:polyprenyl synthetase family protein [Spongiactinospora sp. TRM90649]MDF5753349.1 polyprenyl synthetase family protein [Spongiactinospora sp. TRM90649]
MTGNLARTTGRPSPDAVTASPSAFPPATGGPLAPLTGASLASTTGGAYRSATPATHASRGAPEPPTSDAGAGRHRGGSPGGTLTAHAPVRDGLRRVEATIRRLSNSSRLAAINDATGRITSAGGKRLRPALTLATGLALGGAPTRRLITGAACVELIHAGSLVHDDLMDEAVERRGAQTLNAELGAPRALVIGDFMLARAGLAALTAVSRPVAETLANTTVELAEGQFQETAGLFDPQRTTEDAMRSITGKTASLFRASCLVAAHCAHAAPEQRVGLAVYGERFGQVFQILDDLLDLAADSAVLGKPAGNDLRHGVYTLPLLWALAEPGLDGVRELLGRRLTEEEVEHILHALRRGDLVERTIERCRRMAAETPLPDLPRGEIAESLAALPTAYIDWTAALITR